MSQPPTNSSFGQRATTAFRRLVVTLLILGLAGAVGFLLSQLNARTYTLEQSEGKLRVMKGRMLPFGVEPYRPSDAALADTYAPIDLFGHPAGKIVEAKFTERDELDRALFELLETLARPRVTSDDPHELEQGITSLRRMERLTGATQEQKKTLMSLEAEIAYYRARLRLDDARRALGEALVQLKIAADSPSHNARSAHQMVLEVEGPTKALEEALRRAVHLISTPAPESAVPVPATPAEDAGTPTVVPPTPAP